MHKLQVQHDTTEYKIEVEVVYNCNECNDLHYYYVYAGCGSYYKRPCPFCNAPDEDGFTV